jgi:hypothetical protein
MIPTHSTKHGIRYRYYVSQPYLRGIAKPPAGAIIRVPAAEIESIVTKAVAKHLQSRTRSGIGQHASDQQAVLTNVARVKVRKNQLTVWLKNLEGGEARSNTAKPFDEDATPSLLVPWCKSPSKKPREILLPPSVTRSQVRPIKIERRATFAPIDCPWPRLAGSCCRWRDCRGHRGTP